MGAGSPKHISQCHLPILGSLFWRRRSARVAEAIAAPAWGVGSHDTPFLPKFPGGAQPVLPWLLLPRCLHPACSQGPRSAGDRGWACSAVWVLMHGCRKASLPPSPSAVLGRVSHRYPPRFPTSGLAAPAQIMSQLTSCACRDTLSQCASRFTQPLVPSARELG